MSQEHVDLWNASANTFSQKLEAVSAEQWQSASPCEGWCVQDVVDHAVGAQAGMIGPMLGIEIADGADWPTVHSAISGALTAEALEGTMSHPAMGEVPKGMMFGIMTNDLLVHSWDVARAVGADESLPEAAVAACYTGLQRMPEEMMRAEGRFGPRVESAEGADLQTQMLNFLGRTV